MSKRVLKAVSSIYGRAFIAAGLFLAPAFLPDQRVSAEIVDRIVAVVNDSVITLSELNAAIAVAMERSGNPEKWKKDMVRTRSMVLDSLIEQKLVKQAADKAGIDVSQQEIDNAVEDIKERNNLTQEELVSALAESGITYSEYREQLREQIRQVKFINQEFRSKITISREDVENYYNRHIEEFTGPASYRLRVIFFTGTDKDLLALKIKTVFEALDKGEDFETLARQYSEGPTASSGGDLGYLRADEMDPSLREVASAMSPGSVSRPVRTPSGVYIIQLVDRIEGRPVPFEEVEDRIYDRLFKEALDRRYNHWLEEMKKVAHIDVRL